MVFSNNMLHYRNENKILDRTKETDTDSKIDKLNLNLIDSKTKTKFPILCKLPSEINVL